MVEKFDVPVDYDKNKKSDGLDDIFGDALDTMKKESDNADKPEPLKTYDFDTKSIVKCAVDTWGMTQTDAVTTLNSNIPKTIMGKNKTIDKLDKEQCEAVIKGLMNGTITPF